MVFSCVFPYLCYNGISSFHIDKMINNGRVWLQADIKMLVVSVIDPKA